MSRIEKNLSQESGHPVHPQRTVLLQSEGKVRSIIDAQRCKMNDEIGLDHAHRAQDSKFSALLTNYTTSEASMISAKSTLDIFRLVAWPRDQHVVGKVFHLSHNQFRIEIVFNNDTLKRRSHFELV